MVLIDKPYRSENGISALLYRWTRPV